METFPQWIIILIGTIVLSRVVALLARRFGLPGISIQLLIGILLGPSVLNLLGGPIILGTWGSPSSGPLHTALKILAEIGLIQLMFLAGLEVDWRELKRTVKFSFLMGVWGFGLTGVSVVILTRLFVDRWSEALAMSAIVSTAGFGISIYYFIEMKVLSLRVASMVSGAVILSGLLAILLMIASQATNYAVSYGAFKTTIAVSWFLAKLIMFFAIAYFLTSRFLKLVTKSGFEKRPRQMLIGYLLLVASLYAWAAMHFGSFAAVGVASMGGVLLGVSQPGLKEKIKEGLRSVAGSFPIGIFLVVLGMEVNLKGNEGHIALLVVLLTTVIFTKLVGCRMAFRRISEDLPERFLIMTGMLPQGEMGVIITAYSYSRGLVTPVSFNVAIIVIVVLTMITPILIEVVSRLSLGVAPHCGEKKQSPEIASFRSQ